MSTTTIPITADIEKYYFYNNEQTHQSPRPEKSTISPTSNIINYPLFCSNHDTTPTTEESPCNVACIHHRKSIHNLKSLAAESNLFVNTNWKYINKNGPSEIQLNETIKLELFIQECQNSLQNHQLPFIPVVIGDNIEYIKIIQIRSKYIGIGIKCDHVSQQSLYAFHAQFVKDKYLPLDICRLIMEFCTVIKVSMVHLDFDYILDHHQLLPQHKQYDNLMIIARFKPSFISKLIIEYEPDEDSDIELEEGKALSVQTDWQDDNK